MNAVHRKHVWSDKTIPHFTDDPTEATHRYLYRDLKTWVYVTARDDAMLLAWGAGWLTPERKPQRRAGLTWKDLP